MKRSTDVKRSLALGGLACLGLWASTTGAWAASGATLTWVASSGSDAGTCTETAPCATFRYAASQTATAGTINVLNSGSYGTFKILRSLTVAAPDGVSANIEVAANQSGIEVNNSTAVVLIRGLNIVGSTYKESFGIFAPNVGSLTIDHVTTTSLYAGIYAVGGFVLIRNSNMNGNVYGFYNASAHVFMGQSTVSGNVLGISGGLNSYGDNDMNGNINCDICQATITEVAHDQ